MVSNIYIFVLTDILQISDYITKQRESKLTTVEHRFHIKILRQEQIGLPFESLRGRHRRSTECAFVDLTQLVLLHQIQLHYNNAINHTRSAW